jgi:hypothetical protein
MLTRRIIVWGCAAAMFATVNIRTASAQSMVADSRTEFTFNAPVELPGTTLPPGTYVFRFADPNTSKQVMQVVDKASNKTYGLFLTIQAQRPKAADDAELRFLETPAGKPAAVKTWWYPGNSIGREFIYPKQQARRLAMATNTTVLTTKADTTSVSTEQTKAADLEYISPTGQETAASENSAQMTTATDTTASSNASMSTMNMDRTPVQQSQSASTATSRRRLPRTATTLPLLALIGLTSLAGGAAFRLRRKPVLQRI